MEKQELIVLMTGILQNVLDAHRIDEGGEHVMATHDLPLIGENAAVTSMALVSFIADVESTLMEDYDLSLTLVSERALSRKRSPFLTVEALADYVLELIENPVEVPA